MKKWGLKVDLGMMDVETDAYNTFVSLKEMVLHHRTTPLQDEFTVNDAGVVSDIPDPEPINLLTFNPATNPLPPAKDQHLVWDGYRLRWRRVPTTQPWKRGAQWSQDEWVAEIPHWQTRYGSAFQTYHREGMALIMD
jgi:hypothetical protein